LFALAGLFIGMAAGGIVTVLVMAAVKEHRDQ
jgi:hypothetical protein